MTKKNKNKKIKFLARLHLSAEELLLYPRRRRPHAKMLGQMLNL